MKAALVLVLALLPAFVLGEPPPRPFATFNAAKRVARDAIYADHRTDFYCSCTYSPKKTGSGGVIDATGCGYGACDFEIGGKPSVTEPSDNVRGDAARIWLYMSETYKIKITTAQRAMFKEWSKMDPVDTWERLRDTRIEAAQGNKNPFVQ